MGGGDKNTYTLHPASPNVNLLLNHSPITKTTTLTLTIPALFRRSDFNCVHSPTAVLCLGLEPIQDHTRRSLCGPHQSLIQHGSSTFLCLS